MDKSYTTQCLAAVINALNGVTISGTKNMQALLGSVSALQDLLQKLNEEPESPVPEYTDPEDD